MTLLSGRGGRALGFFVLGAGIAIGCGSNGGNGGGSPPPGPDAGMQSAPPDSGAVVGPPTKDGGPGNALDGAASDAASPPPSPLPLAQYVDPLIGTGLALTTPGAISRRTRGSVFPGADVPFGMVQFSPDTPNGQPSGYVYSDTAITGFSLTHFSGAGCPNNGDVPILPVTSLSETQVTFAHTDETAAAGYYSVKTSDGVLVELTATPRAGVGRFTFPSGGGSLVIDATRNSVFTPVGSITTSSTSLDGTTQSGHFCGAPNYTNLYFHAELDQPFTAAPTTGGKVVLTFASGTAAVTLKIGISYVSGANATANLAAEVGSSDFDTVRTAATALWNARLNAIQVAGASDTEKTKFYTALYHSLLHPNVFSDVNGEYIGFDATTHTATGRVQYANYSGWDIYRSEIQLLAFLFPDVAGDMLEALVDDAQTCGYFVMWAQNNADDTIMAGDPGALIMANGYAFGATNFDQKTALQVLTHPPASSYSCSDPVVFTPGSTYVALGYLTDQYFGGSGATSTTLELTNRDYAVAMFAKAQGDDAHARVYQGRAGTWRYLYAPYAAPGGGTPGPMQLEGRASTGAWNSPMMAPADETDTIEGSSEQYLWDAPYAVPDLVSVLGGQAAFVSRLDAFFTQLNAGQSSQYFYMGNEPGFETPWEYNWAGSASHTQGVINRLVETTFDTTPEGLPGNDDLGAMSSWLVWAMLGMYPEVPGVAGWTLTSPTFASALIYSSNGRTIQIAANEPGPYIQSATVNGAALTSPWLDLPAAATTTQISYVLGANASSWGSALPDPYPSVSADLPSAANNQGIVDETSPDDADLDGSGFALSAQAAEAAGLTGGATVSFDGLPFTWPSPGVDNVVPVGQTITFASPITATKLGLLGTAVNGASTATLVVTTTAGTTVSLPFALDDWTLAAGTATVTAPNQIAATMSYRIDNGTGAKDTTKTYVFYVPISLGASTEIESITLPGQFPGAGTMHLFAFASQ